jgi:hypothetical protein
MDVNDTQYDVGDLVRLAYEDQPAKMQEVFNDLMMDKVYGSIQQKKAEIAQTFFSPQAGGDEDYSDEDNENEEEV